MKIIEYWQISGTAVLSVAMKRLMKLMKILIYLCLHKDLQSIPGLGVTLPIYSQSYLYNDLSYHGNVYIPFFDSK